MELLFRLWIPGYVFLLLGFGQAQGQTPLTEWTQAYSMGGSHEVDKNALLTTLPKLTKEWRLSFEVNPTDYNFYLHEPLENEWLLMSVYPYEVPIYHINANNEDGIGAADIIYQKKIVRKIPGRAKCHDITLKDVVECWRDHLALSIKKKNITCKIPALR